MTKPKAHFFFLNVDDNLGLKRFPKTKQNKLMKIIFKPNVTAVRRFFVALVDLNVDESLFAFFLLIEPQDFFQSRFRWRLRYKKKNAGENWLIFVEDWNLNQKICTFLQFLVDFFRLILLAFPWERWMNFSIESTSISKTCFENVGSKTWFEQIFLILSASRLLKHVLLSKHVFG